MKYRQIDEIYWESTGIRSDNDDLKTIQEYINNPTEYQVIKDHRGWTVDFFEAKRVAATKDSSGYYQVFRDENQNLGFFRKEKKTTYVPEIPEGSWEVRETNTVRGTNKVSNTKKRGRKSQ